MKKIFIPILIIFVVLASLPTGVKAQSGGGWVGAFEYFYTPCITNGTCDLTAAITSVCPAPQAMIAKVHGRTNVNGTDYFASSAGWILVNTIDSNSVTDTNIKNDWIAWYATRGEGLLSYTTGTWNYIHGSPLTSFSQNDTYSDTNGERGPRISEIYFYCAGESSDHLVYLDRFSWQDVPAATGVSFEPGYYGDLFYGVANDLGEEYRAVSSVVSATAGDYATLRVGNDYWNMEGVTPIWNIASPFGTNGITWQKSEFNTYYGSSITWGHTSADDYYYASWFVSTGSDSINFEESFVFVFDTSSENNNGGAFCLLKDCDHEQQPISEFWTAYYSLGRNDFGRIDTSNLFNLWFYGEAHCGSGFQAIGNVNTWFAKSGNFSDIGQVFFWPGGRMYYRLAAKAISNMPVEFYVDIYSRSSGAKTRILNGIAVYGEWGDFSGKTVSTMPEGQYDITIGLLNNFEGDILGIDSTIISTALMNPDSCGDEIIPSATQTGTFSTPTVTVTPNPLTKTPTRTLYPTGIPGPGVIRNCGFGYGEQYWSWSQPSHVEYCESCSEGNYAIVYNQGDITQSFSWEGGIAFVKWLAIVGSSVNVYLIDSQGTRIDLFNGPVTGQSYFINMRTTANLSSGVYTLHLRHGGSQIIPWYDNVTINYGGYGTCVDAVNPTLTTTPINNTPTVVRSNTPTSQNTATMYPTSTSRATSTTLPGTATSTPRPTFTPYPTYTQPPIIPPTATVRPTFTRTPWPTNTLRPTNPPPTNTASSTPRPTNTPNNQGTIEPLATATETPLAPTDSGPTPPNPPTPQPPPDYYAECTRPIDLEPVHWMEYNQCVMLSFFAWSPRAEATMEGWEGLASEREPFGTINEMKDTNNRVNALLQQYDWNHTGVDGVEAPPRPETFLVPDGNNPWFTGRIEFSPPQEYQSTACDAILTNSLGPYITPGFCWMLNFLRSKGILTWLQLLVDIAALAFFWSYIVRKWIDAGSNSQ